mgnify:CR=1 FL=1
MATQLLMPFMLVTYLVIFGSLILAVATRTAGTSPTSQAVNPFPFIPHVHQQYVRVQILNPLPRKSKLFATPKKPVTLYYLEQENIFYAIWDKDEASLSSFDRGDLLQQEILKEVAKFGFDLRVTSTKPIHWDLYHNPDTALTEPPHMGWYIDLVNTEGGNTNNFGERQVSNMIIRNGRLIFTTLIPSDNPCDFGGTGWLMEVNVNTGARLSYSPFDLNSDGTFDISDFVNAGDLDGDGHDDYVAVSGKKSTVGIIPTPSITENLDENKS